MKILFVGDVVGSPGRQIVREELAAVRAEHSADLVIVNCENAASGFGITPKLAEEMLAAGAEVLSGGNHIFDRKEILEYFATEPRLLRPANFAPDSPGRGVFAGKAKNGVPFALLNLQGRTFMAPNDCPFRTADRELERIASASVDSAGPPKIIIVDMHAEATSEKQAMGWYLDGRVTAVLGTHTHVATADERVLPMGTAYITDVGMTGPHDSVIGMDKRAMVRRFLDGMPTKFEVGEGDVRLNAVLIEADERTGRARSISRVRLGLT